MTALSNFLCMCALANAQSQRLFRLHLPAETFILFILVVYLFVHLANKELTVHWLIYCYELIMQPLRIIVAVSVLSAPQYFPFTPETSRNGNDICYYCILMICLNHCVRCAAFIIIMKNTKPFLWTNRVHVHGCLWESDASTFWATDLLWIHLQAATISSTIAIRMFHYNVMLLSAHSERSSSRTDANRTRSWFLFGASKMALFYVRPKVCVMLQPSVEYVYAWMKYERKNICVKWIHLWSLAPARASQPFTTPATHIESNCDLWPSPRAPSPSSPASPLATSATLIYVPNERTSTFAHSFVDS